MCDMLERPLLYIVSPTYMLQHESCDESTSVYERNEPEQINNELIIRQLHYFAGASKPRHVILLLTTGERVFGQIISIQGEEVKVACYEQTRLIQVNTIVAIHAAK